MGKKISFYRIAEELYEESEKIKGCDYENFKKKRQLYLETILSHAGMLDEYKIKTDKRIKFEIPEEEKYWIKLLIRTYAEPVSRKIRQDKIDEITQEELCRLYKKLLEIVEKNFPDDEKMDSKGRITGMLRVNSQVAFEEVETCLLKMMTDDLNSI
ncbi:MAG: hypothetical protein ACRC8T_01140, partial [Acidaminococcaceae bacterium]